MLDAEQSAVDAIRQAAQSDGLLTAARIGVAPDAMSRSTHDGVLERVIPGVYVGARHQQHPLIEAAAWTLRFNGAVVCLLTAAAFHDLTDAFPRGTWLYVAKGESRPRSRVVAVHVVQTAPKYISPDHAKQTGIVKKKVHGVDIRITGADRTTLDLWRYPHRIAREHALEALRRRVRAEGFHLPSFARLANRLGIWSKVEPIVQGLVLR